MGGSLEMIRAGTLAEINPESGDWLFVDVGFAQTARSCGILAGTGVPEEVSFNILCAKIIATASKNAGPLNLLIEAPLSVAFNSAGNPTGRSIEKRGAKTRYWYVGLGCCVLVAATYIMRKMVSAHVQREVRLFEGFASFKIKGQRSSHSHDVIRLRQVVSEPNSRIGSIVVPDRLRIFANDRIESAFEVAGMDLGVPPVVILHD